MEHRAFLTKLEASGWGYGDLHFDGLGIGDLSPNLWNLLIDSNYLDRIEIVSFIGNDFENGLDVSLLVELKNLKRISVSNTQFEDLTPLAELKNLEHLDVFYTQVTDLTPLAELKNLKRLYFYKTHVKDLAPLAELKNLKFLGVDNTQISNQQIHQLLDALPDCRRVYNTYPN